jgi:hypothetical protein
LARRNRLVSEIYNFLTESPGVNAAAISGYLTAEVKMRNSGLTSRKIGFFIPRYCKEKIRFEEQNGGRMYFPIKEEDQNKEGLENIIKK